MKPPHSLTKDDVPPEPTPEALLAECSEHPEADWAPGFGYKGGGFGPYKRCLVCNKAFAKHHIGE